MRLEARVAELVGAEALNGAGAVGDRHLLGGGHRGSVDGPVADAHFADLSAIARSRGEGHAKAPIERFAGPARPLVNSTTPGHRQNQSRQNPKLHVRSSLSMRTDQLAKTVVKGAA